MTAAGALFVPLRRREFRLLWLGASTSLLGDGVYLVALAWQAYSLTHRPGGLALLGVCATVPQLLALIAGGVISDRFERRHVLLAADVWPLRRRRRRLRFRPARPRPDVAPGPAQRDLRVGRGRGRAGLRRGRAQPGPGGRTGAGERHRPVPPPGDAAPGRPGARRGPDRDRRRGLRVPAERAHLPGVGRVPVADAEHQPAGVAGGWGRCGGSGERFPARGGPVRGAVCPQPGLAVGHLRRSHRGLPAVHRADRGAVALRAAGGPARRRARLRIHPGRGRGRRPGRGRTGRHDRAAPPPADLHVRRAGPARPWRSPATGWLTPAGSSR